MTGKKDQPKQPDSATAASTARLRSLLHMFAEWSDCLQRARDPDALVSGLCRTLTSTGGYAHVDVVLGLPGTGRSWSFVPDAFSLPLRHQGRRLGALTVAPPHGNGTLPDEELEMLAALADDLAFGIDSFTAEQDRDRAQARLDLLSRAIEQSPFAVVITDGNGRIQYGNSSLTAMTGYSLEEMLGQLPSLWKSGDTPDEVYRDMWRAASEGLRWQGEIRNRRKDGSLYWERQTISSIRDADGRVAQLIAIKEDTTLVREMSQALTLREQALASSSNGIMITRSKADDHSIVYANPAFERITGYKVEEVIGLEGRFLVRDDLAQPGLNEIRNARPCGAAQLPQGRVAVLERTVHRADQRPVATGNDALRQCDQRRQRAHPRAAGHRAPGNARQSHRPGQPHAAARPHRTGDRLRPPFRPLRRGHVARSRSLQARQ
jgi:PAS domain S-box-containing protein